MLRLGTIVMVLPWHNPVLLAEQAATINWLSDGRLDLGFGQGDRYNFARVSTPMKKDMREAEAGVLYRTPNEISEGLQRLRDFGAEYVLVNSPSGLTTLRRRDHARLCR